jgi:broad specificity phosphatase PhoE
MKLNLRRWPAALFLAMAMLAIAPPTQSAATEAAWARLAQGGYTILLGYARTPGGEPLRPDLGDCENRKSLTDRGIQEARRIGMRFAARAVSISAVYSGEFCRALETAELAFGSSNVETRAYLNSIVSGGDPDLIPGELIAAVDELLWRRQSADGHPSGPDPCHFRNHTARRRGSHHRAGHQSRRQAARHQPPVARLDPGAASAEIAVAVAEAVVCG